MLALTPSFFELAAVGGVAVIGTIFALYAWLVNAELDRLHARIEALEATGYETDGGSDDVPRL